MSDLPPWTKINKGDRRPADRVLVSYDYKDLLDGQKRWGVTGAWWNPKLQRWIADHGKPITNVTHWMPMPTGGKEMPKVTMCDPPSGWKYGFPKPVPDHVDDIRSWLLSEGYPQAEIDACGKHFYVRYWEEDGNER